MKNYIPKTIHYCWFGGNELGEKEKKCIESWKRIMPDYKIIRWDESNYDTNKNDFIKNAMKYKKWAFVSDYARLDIIYNYGGIYLDTDVEVIKSFDDLLKNKSFYGFESNQFVANGLGFGAEKNNEIVRENMDLYTNINFDINNLNSISCPKITTEILKKHGLILNNKFQQLDFATVYPKDFFCPKNYSTGELKVTENTFSIHHYSMSWHSLRDKRWQLINQKLSKLFGTKISLFITIIMKFPGSFITSIKKYGIINTFKIYYKKLKGMRK